MTIPFQRIQVVKKSFKVSSSAQVIMRLTLCRRKLTILFKGWGTMSNLRSEIWMRIAGLMTLPLNTSKNVRKKEHCSFPYLKRFIRRRYACRTIYSVMDSAMASQKPVTLSTTSIWTVFYSTIVVWLVTNFRRFSKVLPLSKTSNRLSTSTTSWTRSQYRSFSRFLKRIYPTSSKSLS